MRRRTSAPTILLFLSLGVVAVSSQAPTPSGRAVPVVPTPSPSMPQEKPRLPRASNHIEKVLLREYGAVFAAQGVKVPVRIFFKDEADVTAFQKAAGEKTADLDGVTVTLQKAALDGLRKAIDEAAAAGLRITPRDYDAAKRSYADTVGLWASRVEPALDHWVAKGRIEPEDAEEIRELSPFEQIPRIFELEKKKIYFAKDLTKSIIYSVAPPGSSQHLSMLAFDVTEHADSRIRAILARHGWFQTVISDLPHFTYLGAREDELPKLGLSKMLHSGRVFWVPAQKG